MNISRSLILGIAALPIAESAGDWLPGEASWSTVLVAAPVLLAPPILTSWSVQTLLRRAEGWRRRVAIFLFTFRWVLIAASYATLLFAGGLIDAAATWSPESMLGRLSILLAPLVLVELLTRAAEQPAFPPNAQSEPAIGGRLSWTIGAIVPFLAIGVLADLLAASRTVEVALSDTALGNTVGCLLTVLIGGALLPLLLRFVLPLDRSLPATVAEDVYQTAERLGFSREQVLRLRTGGRMDNAAMVGLVPKLRYLLLTDGIASSLDAMALRGVVAHEVGHARSHHPALIVLLFVAIPVLLMQPVSLLPLDDTNPYVLIGAGAGLAALAWLGARSVMHRFEFEADQQAAVSLGGAMPCVVALKRVGDPTRRHRASFRHPSEDQRIRSLLAWETDERHRAAFARRGVVLRRGIAALLLATVAVSSWAHGREWAFDRAILSLYTGDFGAAVSQLEQMDGEDSRTSELLDEARLAVELVGPGGDWESIREPLSSSAWERALEGLTKREPVELLPLLGLANVGPRDPVRLNAWLWVAARADGDDVQARRVAAHLEQLGPPQQLLEALRRGP